MQGTAPLVLDRGAHQAGERHDRERHRDHDPFPPQAERRCFPDPKSPDRLAAYEPLEQDRERDAEDEVQVRVEA
jgi:hypothetical protein